MCIIQLIQKYGCHFIRAVVFIKTISIRTILSRLMLFLIGHWIEIFPSLRMHIVPFKTDIRWKATHSSRKRKNPKFSLIVLLQMTNRRRSTASSPKRDSSKARFRRPSRITTWSPSVVTSDRTKRNNPLHFTPSCTNRPTFETSAKVHPAPPTACIYTIWGKTHSIEKIARKRGVKDGCWRPRRSCRTMIRRSGIWTKRNILSRHRST